MIAVSETVQSRRVTVLLDNGTTVLGSVKTISESLGTLGSPSTWDTQKAYNIPEKLGPCLEKAIYNVSSVTTAYIDK